MAFVIQKADGRFEIRESVHVPGKKHPVSRTLAGFKNVLTMAVLNAAEAKASATFSPEAVIESARKRGARIAFSHSARAFLKDLRRGIEIDPIYLELIRRELLNLSSTPIPPEIDDVGDWIGRPTSDHAEALVELLELADTIADSRPSPKLPKHQPFPRFHIKPGAKLPDEAA
jgi:hypothetical protein